MSAANFGPYVFYMQGQQRVKIVPRVLFELDKAGLLQLLSKPHAVAEPLVNLCKKHGFDGLVSRQCLDVVCARKLMHAYDLGMVPILMVLMPRAEIGPSCLCLMCMVRHALTKTSHASMWPAFASMQQTQTLAFSNYTQIVT